MEQVLIVLVQGFAILFLEGFEENVILVSPQQRSRLFGDEGDGDEVGEGLFPLVHTGYYYKNKHLINYEQKEIGGGQLQE